VEKITLYRRLQRQPIQRRQTILLSARLVFETATLRNGFLIPTIILFTRRVRGSPEHDKNIISRNWIVPFSPDDLFATMNNGRLERKE
jgi:hypothetical protein